MRALYTITDLTREFEVTTRTLRFYEQQGLIDPLRRGRTRLYRPADRTRLNLILRGKRLGFSLAEIREIVDMYDAPPGEHGQLTLLVDKIARKRTELQARRHDIDQTLAELDAVEAGCRDRLAKIPKGRQ
ncbi:MerR family DNA-binding transcriptional regulator [Microbaculum marinum]|uniref:MerR family DNA-binding transcriptional regulator n=1 Tax=Microbaculum marinum TaxID=1764581 RepID=A0AAW9S564_9HYPH